MSRRILIVGERPTDRTGLRTVLSGGVFEIVGESASGVAAVDTARRLQPELAILFLDMAAVETTALLGGLLRASPATRLVGVGPTPSRGDLEAAFKAGLRGFVAREEAAHGLVRALREVARGQLFVSPRASRALVAGVLTEVL